MIDHAAPFWLRIARAKEQLRTLLSEIDGYTDTARQGEGFEVLCEKNPEASNYIHKLRVPITPNYLMWSVAIGEIVQNARVPLDQLAFALVKSTGSEPDNKTAFPVFDDPDRYKGTPPKYKWDASGLRKIEHMDGLAQAEIARLQPYPPYTYAQAEGLLFLDRLWRTDKHLAPLIGSAAAGFLTAVTASWGKTAAHVVIEDFFPYEDGARVGTSDEPVEVHLSITVEVKFRQGGPWRSREPFEGKPIAEALKAATEAAHYVVGRLEPFVKWSAFS
jgi:hypothetical protein